MNWPRTFCAFVFASGLAFQALAEDSALLPNAGFEEGLSGWTAPAVEETKVSVTPDAAREGKAGLRVEDESASRSAKVLSTTQAAQPGKTYRVNFWARTGTPGRMGVFLRFDDATHHVIDPEHLAFRNVDGSDLQWQPYHVEARAPDNAAFLTVWIHSYSRFTGAVDFDDFSLENSDESPIATAATSSSSPSAAPPATAMPVPSAAISSAPRDPASKPPVILLKLDDFRAVEGRRALPAQWQKVADLLEARHIKASIGIICNSLEKANDASLEWIKNLQSSGLVEFWFHGLDHQGWLDTDGKAYAEFRKRPYEEQKQRFERSQQIAEEKLGFPFRTFGPPGFVPPPGGSNENPVLVTPNAPAFPGDNAGGFDSSTIRVMQEDPNMVAWLYPTPIDAAGRELEAKGKVTILDRAWNANIETPLFRPNLEKLKEGYAATASHRDYLVLQGHPTHWDDEKFAEFVRIIDFLTAQGVVFMTPAEYCNSRAKANSPPPTKTEKAK